MYEAQSNDAAKTGDGLLDIKGRVRSIDVVEMQQLAAGPTARPVGSVTDPVAIDQLVGLLLAAPIESREPSAEPAPYRLDLTLDDGSVIERDYFAATGGIVDGGTQEIVVPIAFLQKLVDLVGGGLVKMLGAAQAPPTPTAVPIATSCLVEQATCDFATRLAVQMGSNPIDAVLGQMNPVTLTCPPTEDRVPGLDLACAGLAPGDTVSGMTYDAVAKAWAFFPVAMFRQFVAGIFNELGKDQWKISAIACQGSDSTSLRTCDATFAISISPIARPYAVLVLFYHRDSITDDPRLTGLANWSADSPAERGGELTLGTYDADGLGLHEYWFQPWSPPVH